MVMSWIWLEGPQFAAPVISLVMPNLSTSESLGHYYKYRVLGLTTPCQPSNQYF